MEHDVLEHGACHLGAWGMPPWCRGGMIWGAKSIDFSGFGGRGPDVGHRTSDPGSPRARRKFVYIGVWCMVNGVSVPNDRF